MGVRSAIFWQYLQNSRDSLTTIKTGKASREDIGHNRKSCALWMVIAGVHKMHLTANQNPKQTKSSGYENGFGTVISREGNLNFEFEVQTCTHVLASSYQKTLHSFTNCLIRIMNVIIK